MGRPPNPNKRTNMVCVRLNDAEQTQLDQLRGGLSRGEWLRQQVRANRKGEQGPEAVVPTGYNDWIHPPEFFVPEPITPEAINEGIETRADSGDPE